MAHPLSAAQVKNGSRLAPDARADHGTRLITFTADMINIERLLNGMKMRVHVPTQLYFGVALQSHATSHGALYELKLAHRDPDLTVFLEAPANKQEAERLCRQWASFFGRPALKDDLTAAESRDQRKATLPTPRRRCMTTVAQRRPRRFARRKAGNRENLAIVRHGEREIICYE